jgi:hypothetical protein
MDKSPKFSDDELLKLLDSSDESEIDSTFDSSVLSFAIIFNLRPGKDKVLKKHLYKLYQVWNKGTKKIAQHEFTKQLTDLVDHTEKFFLIDQDAFQIANFIKEEKAKRKVDKSKSKYWRAHFHSFLKDTELVAGTVYIELEIVYFLYLEWRTKARKTTRLSRRQFIKILDLYFDVKAISAGDHLWVGFSDHIYNLITKKEVDRWRNTREKKDKRFYYPKKEWKQFAIYWQEKNK